MPIIPIENALVTQAEIGHEGVEPAISTGHNFMPDRIEGNL